MIENADRAVAVFVRLSTARVALQEALSVGGRAHPDLALTIMRAIQATEQARALCGVLDKATD